MLRKTLLVVVALGVLAAPGAQAADETGAKLTPADFANIYHLYARYAHGIDSKANEGALYASVWMPDGFFRAEFDNFTSPLPNLIQRYGRSATGATNPITAGGHQTWNIVIEPAPWGALGRAYMGNGMYFDTIVKTPQGWRFQGRNYRWDLAFPSMRAPRPAPAPGPQTAQ